MTHAFYGGLARYQTRWAHTSYCPHPRALYFCSYLHPQSSGYGMQKTASRMDAPVMWARIGTLSGAVAHAQVTSRSAAYRVTYDCTECHTGEAQ